MKEPKKFKKIILTVPDVTGLIKRLRYDFALNCIISMLASGFAVLSMLVFDVHVSIAYVFTLIGGYHVGRAVSFRECRQAVERRAIIVRKTKRK